MYQYHCHFWHSENWEVAKVGWISFGKCQQVGFLKTKQHNNESETSLTLPITMPNVDRFAKPIHCWNHNLFHYKTVAVLPITLYKCNYFAKWDATNKFYVVDNQTRHVRQWRKCYFPHTLCASALLQRISSKCPLLFICTEQEMGSFIKDALCRRRSHTLIIECHFFLHFLTHKSDMYVLNYTTLH